MTHATIQGATALLGGGAVFLAAALAQQHPPGGVLNIEVVLSSGPLDLCLR